jgi:predicted transcriptional regulator YdeE
MEPKIVNRETFNIMGVLAQGDPRNMNFAEIWNKFISYRDQVSSFSVGKAYYGVFFGPQGIRDVDFVAGMSVENVSDIPEGLVVREVPDMCCAVFQCTMKTIGQTYDYVYQKWIPQSQYEHDKDKPDIECYPPNSSTPDPTVYIYIPIKI